MTAVIVALLAGFLLLPVVLFELPYQVGRWRRYRRRRRVLVLWAGPDRRGRGREASSPSEEFPYQVRHPNSGSDAGRDRDPVRDRRDSGDLASPPGPSGGDGA